MRGNIFSPEYMISNAIAILLLFLAWRRPLAATISMTLLFIGAAIFNMITAVFVPDKYMAFADVAALPVYERFINGYFSQHVRSIILSIAVLQLLAGIFMLAPRGWSAAAFAGAALFLLAIAPLGAGAAFPCSLLLAVACIILLVKGRKGERVVHKLISDKQRYDENTFPHY